jgi:uncharacterized protein (TIGR02147 family)
MRIPLFEYESYTSYLTATLESGKRARGFKARLARHLGCHTSYISQVLGDRVHLSLEHSMRVSDFLKHSVDERRYFALLVQKGKAGTPELKAFYQTQIDELKSRRQPIRERIQVADQLNTEDRATYYSAWWYAAIHVLTAFDDIKTAEDIALRLRLNQQTVDHVLEFLVARGLVTHTPSGYRMGATRIHLGADSHLIARHHANWRLKAVEAQEQMNPRNLHYSAVIGISQKDALKLRSAMLDLIQNTEPVIRESKEEAPYVLLMDFFGV